MKKAQIFLTGVLLGIVLAQPAVRDIIKSVKGALTDVVEKATDVMADEETCEDKIF